VKQLLKRPAHWLDDEPLIYHEGDHVDLILGGKVVATRIVTTKEQWDSLRPDFEAIIAAEIEKANGRNA
jgi:hypothetical protein